MTRTGGRGAYVRTLLDGIPNRPDPEATERALRRARLTGLDGLLTRLEDLPERGLRAVGLQMATDAQRLGADVTPGMSFAEAIERVFTAQEDCLIPLPPPAVLRRLRPVRGLPRDVRAVVAGLGLGPRPTPVGPRSDTRTDLAS